MFCFFFLKIKITGGGDGVCLAEFTIAPEHLNRMGGLHGGFTATIVDNMTTCALLTKEGVSPGVTVDLHVRLVLMVFELNILYLKFFFGCVQLFKGCQRR